MFTSDFQSRYQSERQGTLLLMRFSMRVIMVFHFIKMEGISWEGGWRWH